VTEAQLSHRIVGALYGLPSTFAFKIAAAPYARRGISDVLCISNGVFFALETKLPGKEKTLTMLQKLFLAAVNRCGGYSTMVTSVEQAVEFVTTRNGTKTNVLSVIEAPDGQVFHLEQQAQQIDRPIGPHD
jgi:hypothetical protein